MKSMLYGKNPFLPAKMGFCQSGFTAAEKPVFPPTGKNLPTLDLCVQGK